MQQPTKATIRACRPCARIAIYDARHACPLLRPLGGLGYQATVFRTVVALCRAVREHHFDIAIIVEGPHDGDADVLRQLGHMARGGVVVLRRKHARDDILQAFEDGADACLPHDDIDMLVATLHNLTRRLGRTAANDDISIEATHRSSDVRAWQLASDGWSLYSPQRIAVQLTPQEYVFMRLLASTAGAPVAVERIVGELAASGRPLNTPHLVQMLVYRLRRKALERTGLSLPLLTARGAGYIFAVNPAEEKWDSPAKHARSNHSIYR